MERGNGIKSGILGLEGDNGNFHLDPSAFSIAFSSFPQQLEIWDGCGFRDGSGIAAPRGGGG